MNAKATWMINLFLESDTFELVDSPLSGSPLLTSSELHGDGSVTVRWERKGIMKEVHFPKAHLASAKVKGAIVEVVAADSTVYDIKFYNLFTLQPFDV